jgi:uncharacterized damage-inducible protein DinB
MNKISQANEPEPWLRGTLTEVPVVARAVLHALQLANEDLHRWAGELSDGELNQRPFGLASVAFHVRHIAGSLDRLLTYAEGRQLSSDQIAFLKSELEAHSAQESLFKDLASAFERSAQRIRVLADSDLTEKREVGSKRLPTTLGGSLVHIADHAQRHVGQAVTTAKIVLASRKK